MDLTHRANPHPVSLRKVMSDACHPFTLCHPVGPVLVRP